MDRLRPLALVAATIVIAAALAGCSAPVPSPASSSGTPASTTSATAVPTAVPTALPTAAPSTVSVSKPSNETLLGSLSSQRGTNALGPFRSSSKSIAVYVKCVGSGSVQVTVTGVAQFPNDCDAAGTDAGIRNVLDVRFVDKFSVRVSGENTLVWAVTVTTGH